MNYGPTDEFCHKHSHIPFCVWHLRLIYNVSFKKAYIDILLPRELKTGTLPYLFSWGGDGYMEGKDGGGGGEGEEEECIYM